MLMPFLLRLNPSSSQSLYVIPHLMRNPELSLGTGLCPVLYTGKGFQIPAGVYPWIPAFAGMTGKQE